MTTMEDATDVTAPPLSMPRLPPWRGVDRSAPEHRGDGDGDGNAVHDIHFIENTDLTVILKRGNEAEGALQVRSPGVETGHVVIALGVDGEHDQMHYKCTGGVDRVSTRERLVQAIEVLVACRDAASRVGRHDG